MTSLNPHILLAQERGMVSHCMDLSADTGAPLGCLVWAKNPQALNASSGPQRLGDDAYTRLECAGSAYRIDFENIYDEKNQRTGTRFLLRPLGGGEIIAAGRRDFGSLGKMPLLSLEYPCKGQFIRRWKWFRGHWDWLSPRGDEVIGYIEEPLALSLTRRLKASLPHLTRPQQALCIYMFCFMKYMGGSSVPK